MIPAPDTQDNATPVGAIAELQREAADLRRMAEVFLSMAERLHRRIEEAEGRDAGSPQNT
jgi:hypothetical protein